MTIAISSLITPYLSPGNVTTSGANTINQSVALGDVVVISAEGGGGTTTFSVSDSKGNTWTQLGLIGATSGAAVTVVQYYSVITTAMVSGVDTITVNRTSGTGSLIAYAERLTGVDGVTPIDNSGTPATGFNNTVTQTETTAALTIAANSIIIMVTGVSTSYSTYAATTGLGYTLLHGPDSSTGTGNPRTAGLIYQIFGTGGTYTPSVTTGNAQTYAAVAVALKAGGAALTSSVTDLVGVTDDPQETRTVPIVDAVGLTDTSAGARGLNPVITDSVGLTDTGNAQSVGYSVTLTESVGLSDTNTLSRGVVNIDTEALTDTQSFDAAYNLADAVGVSDTATGLKFVLVNVNDSVGLTDASTNTQTVAPTDTEGVTDSTFVEVNRSLSLPETVGLTDSVAGSTTSSPSDAEGITDSMTVTVGRYQSTTDSLGVTDTTSQLSNQIVGINDSVGITETVGASASGSIAQSILDGENLTDSTTVLSASARVQTDPVGVTDITNVVVTDSATESVQLSDALVVDRTFAPIDSVGVTDLPQLVMTSSFSYTLNEAMGTTDLVAELVDRIISDALGVTDTAGKAMQLIVNDTINVSEATPLIVNPSITDYVTMTDNSPDGMVLERNPVITDDYNLSDVVTVKLTLPNAYSFTNYEAVGITERVLVDFRDLPPIPRYFTVRYITPHITNRS